VAKNTKTSTSKLNLKAKKIRIETFETFENKPWVETASLGGNWLSKN
jgi:hypothetical protein